MKKICLFAASVILANTAMAQLKIGPEVGLNINKLNYSSSTESASNMGLRIGAVMDIGFGKLSLQPGVFYSTRGGEVKFTDAAKNAYEISTSLGYIEVPLLLQYKIAAGPGKFFLGAGPTASIAISGKQKTAMTPPGGSTEKKESDIEFGSAATELSGSDIGLMFNLGYEFNKGLFFRPFYHMGMSNLSNGTTGSIKNATFGISAGWFFGM